MNNQRTFSTTSDLYSAGVIKNTGGGGGVKIQQDTYTLKTTNKVQNDYLCAGKTVNSLRGIKKETHKVIIDWLVKQPNYSGSCF